MSYLRVIPRDLFNEANLLKCMGRLWILAETTSGVVSVEFAGEGTDAPFDIHQDESTGEIFVANVWVTVNGRIVAIRRPLNSREDWPLYASLWDEGPVPVFDDAGKLTEDFLQLGRERG